MWITFFLKSILFLFKLSISEWNNYFELIRFANSKIEWIHRSIILHFDSSIPFEESFSRFTQIYTSHYWSIIIIKNSSLLRGNARGWGKNGPSEICPVAASRNNIVTTRDTPHSRRRVAVSMHCYGERIVTSMFPPYIYIFGKHRDSPTSLDLSKRGLLLFFFLFFQTYLLQNRPCAFSRPLFPG